MKDLLEAASQKNRHEKKMDIKIKSKIEGEGLSLEGGMPPSSEGSKMMQIQVHLLGMRDFLSMSQGPTVGVGDIAIAIFGKYNLP